MRQNNNKASVLTGQALKDFRHAVSKLKSKGLLSKKTDARKQKPTKYMRAKVKALAPVLSGDLAPVRRSAAIAREYKLAGFQVYNNRLLLPPEQAKSVRSTRNEYMTLEKMTQGGTVERRVILPVSVKNIDDFLSNEPRIDRLIGPGRRLAFTYYGNKSLQTFPNASAIFEYIQYYSVVTGDDGEKEQAWDNLVLFSLTDPRAIEWENEAQISSEEKRVIRAREYRRKIRRTDATGRTIDYTPRQPFSREREKVQDAQYKKAKRATMSEEEKAAMYKRNAEYKRAKRFAMTDAERREIRLREKIARALK